MSELGWMPPVRKRSGPARSNLAVWRLTHPFKGVIVKRIHIRLIRIWSRTNADSVAVAVDGINPCAPLRR